MKKFVIALSALSLLAGSSAVTAAAAPQRCRDTKGHFVKCPQKVAAKAQRCRDTKGHFAKCGTKGAKPA
jgi:hypothetical protein